MVEIDLTNCQRDDEHFLYRIERAQETAQKLIDAFNARIVLLHGSVAQAVHNQHDNYMNDTDFVLVTDSPPNIEDLKSNDLDRDSCNLIAETPGTIEKIGSVLRYTPTRLVALRLLGAPSIPNITFHPSELGQFQVSSIFNRRQHILACMLLGSKKAYTKCGLQKPNERGIDNSKKDHSAHVVLHDPEELWPDLQQYAQEYRGPYGYFADLSKGQTRCKHSEGNT